LKFEFRLYDTAGNLIIYSSTNTELSLSLFDISVSLNGVTTSLNSALTIDSSTN